MIKFKLLLSFLFYFSGATALVYQVVWIRHLRISVGGTVEASSMVIAVFLGGLALGAWAIKLVMNRLSTTGGVLLAYGAIELVLGTLGWFSTDILQLADQVALSLQGSRGLPSTLLPGTLLTVASLLPPTLLMGATLPLLVHCFTLLSKELSKQSVGLLYGINTVGAACGSLLCGFLLIPRLGLKDATVVAAAANLFIALVAAVVGLAGKTRRITPSKSENSQGLMPRLAPQAILPVAVFFGVGIVTLALEVLYLRFLLPVIGISTYAVSLVLTCFIGGMGLGSLFGAHRAAAARRPERQFAAIQGLLAAMLLIQLVTAQHIPLVYVQAFHLFGHSFASSMIAGVLTAALLIFLPSLLIGAAFPMMVAWHDQRMGKTAAATANIYVAGTVGNIIGALLAPFVLIPLLGVQWAFAMLALITLTVAWIAAGRDVIRPQLGVACVAGLALLLFIMPTWSDDMLSGGAFYKVKAISPTSKELKKELSNGEVIYFKEGPSATVSVLEYGKARVLQINGKPVASDTSTDLRNQYLLSLIPYILHGHAERGLVVGIGTGVTCGTMGLVSSKTDCVELSKEVLPATSLFAKVNFDVLNKDNVTIIIDDGRRFIRSTSKTYNYITSDPSLGCWIQFTLLKGTFRSRA